MLCKAHTLDHETSMETHENWAHAKLCGPGLDDVNMKMGLITNPPNDKTSLLSV